MDASTEGGKMTRGQREIAHLQAQLREAAQVSEHLRQLLGDALAKPTSTVENLNMQLIEELQEKEAEMAQMASTMERERREWAERVADHERKAAERIEWEKGEFAERMAEQDRKVAETIERERRQCAEKMEGHERRTAEAIEMMRRESAERIAEHERETAETKEENRKEFEKALAAEKERGDTTEIQLRRSNETISHLAKKLREAKKEITSIRKRSSPHAVGINLKASFPSSCRVPFCAPPRDPRPSFNNPPYPVSMLPMPAAGSSTGSSQMCFCANPPPASVPPPYAAPRPPMPSVNFNSPSLFPKRRSQSGRRSTGRNEFSRGWMWAACKPTIDNATAPATTTPHADDTMRLEEGEKSETSETKEPNTAQDSNCQGHWVSWRPGPPCC